ncbi:MAG: ATP-grasp domain-containing protein [Bacillota bacterium]|jgi:D-alanine-D-alanine ligase|nr:ATP-grasp domain-containing protein [Bacillota bacterium]
MANVGLLYNLGKHDPPEDGEPPDANAELDGESTVIAIADALRWGGHEVVFVEGNEDAYEHLRHSGVDIVFNICEGVRGESRESHVPAMCEMLGIPYAGSKVLALALSLDKPAAKKVFVYHGIPTPKFKVFGPYDRVNASGLQFPLFAKPAHEGSSMGVSPNSLVTNKFELEQQVRYITKFYRQEALVEEFIDGREFTVGILGNEDPHVFPVMEITFKHCPAEHRNIYSRQYKAEWDDESYYPCPAEISDEETRLLKDTAVQAYHALDCLDVGRVDFRMKDGIPYVLEINPLPGLTPGFSDLPRIANAGGMSYNELVNLILDHALMRYGMENLRSNLALVQSRTAN